MSTTNPVFQVLVTSGDQAPLAAGSAVSALAPGQIGVFNYHTGLSLGAASAVGDTRDIFLAVGVNRSGTSTLEDINKSGGQYIQSERVTRYMHRNYTAPAPMIVDITNYKIYAEQEYGIKVEFRNQHIYAMNGYNQFTKTWLESGGCAESGDCVDCGTTGDCNAWTIKMVNQINLDKDELVKADFLDYTTDPDAPVVVTAANVAAWIADTDNAGLCLGIRLTSIPEKIYTYCSVNLKYFNPRGTVLIPSLIEGFACNGVITIQQEVGYEEGAGYDIRDLEYTAGGWNGKPGPYRVSELLGVAREGFEYFATSSAKYSQFTLTYDLMSQSNFLKYYANNQTIIAVPCADETTRDGLVAILDHIFTQFPANAANAALGDCTGASHTNQYAVANNGIKFLA